jgi:hypothetical protein
MARMMFNQLRHIGRMCGCLVLIVLANSALADESSEMDRYLSQLGLIDLRLALHEAELRQATSEAVRAREAKILADIYSQRLLEVAAQPEKHGLLVARVKQLAKLYPVVDSPALRVMLLQAEYQRVEVLTLRWIDDPLNEATRNEAKALLESLGPAFRKLREELSSLVEEKLARTEANVPPSKATVTIRAENKRAATLQPTATGILDKEIEHDQVALSRALFFEGWSSLFRGFLEEESSKSREHLEAALTAFARLLDLSTDNEKLDIPADQLGLQSVWRSRTLLGFATTLTALNKHPLANSAFAALESNGDSSVSEAAFYWHALAMVRTQQWNELRQLTGPVFTQSNAKNSNRLVSSAVLLVRNGWSQAQPSADEATLTRTALASLAKWKKYDVLAALVEKYRATPQTEDGFYALWTKGKLLFAAAEKEPTPAAYQAAERWFRDALALPEAKDDPIAVANCEYGLAWCEYRREAFVDALRRFEQSAASLKTLGDDAAVQAAWMVFTCYQAQHAKTNDPRDAEAASNALRKLMRDFPESSQAKKAEFLLAKLKAPGETPVAALKTLSAVPADSAHYVSARYEVAVLQHQLWAEVKSTDPAKRELGEKTRREVDTYLNVAPVTEGPRRVKAMLLAVATFIPSDAAAWDGIAKYLDREQAVAAKLRSDDPSAAEYHYRRLELAQQRNQEQEIQEHAKWLTDHAPNSPFELPALVIVARGLDQRYQAANEQQRRELRVPAMKTYQKLSTAWGDSPEILSTKKNAVIALSKLAQYAFDAGEYSTAAQQLEKILAAYPQDASYLRRAALAWWDAKEPANALPHWQKLVAGSDTSSAGWYEAKYYQIKCLLQTDPTAATKIWKQFELLHPEVKQAEWRERFSELERSHFSDSK